MTPVPEQEGCTWLAVTRVTMGLGATHKSTKRHLTAPGTGAASPWTWGVGWQRPSHLPPSATNPGHWAEHPTLHWVPNSHPCHHHIR